MIGLGETLVQTPPAVALFGDETAYTGLARGVVYRWFTDPAARLIYPEEDHPLHGRAFTADLRHGLHPRRPAAPRAAEIVDALLPRPAPEFAAVWAEHEVGPQASETKRINHPEVGRAGAALPDPLRPRPEPGPARVHRRRRAARATRSSGC